MATFTKEEIENIKGIYDNLMPEIQLKAKDPNTFKRIKQEATLLFTKNDTKLMTNIVGRQLLINQKFEDNILNILGVESKEIVSLIKSSEYFKKFGELQLTNQLAFAIPLLILSCEYEKLGKSENAQFIYLLIFMKPYASRVSQHWKFPVNEGQMQYTVEHLSEKSDIKKLGTVMDVLVKKSKNSFDNYLAGSKKDRELTDRELHVIYTAGVASRVNSFLAGIYDEYKKNAGKSLDFEDSGFMTTDSDTGDTDYDARDINSDTELKYKAVSNIMMSITKDPIDTKLAIIAVRRYFGPSQMYVDILKHLIDSVIENMLDDLPTFFSSLLGSFLFELKPDGSRYTMQDFKTPVYLNAAMQIFTYSNLKNENMLKVKDMLKKMLETYSTEYIGLGTSQKRNLRNTLMFYWVLLSQKAASNG